MISVSDLYKSFGKNSVLKGLNIDFSPNKITAVLGPNSSGKTTLMKSILGMVIPDAGTIKIDGQSIHFSPDYRNKIGYLPQIARFPENLKVKELFMMINDLRRDSASYGNLLKSFELEGFMDQALGHLSGGTRQKVNIVQAFMFDSPYLLLDEPTAGLDPVSLIRLKHLINHEKKKGKTVLITSHIMSFVEEIADEVIFVLDGKIHLNAPPRKIIEDYGASTLEQAIAKVLSGLPKIGSNNGHKKEDEELIQLIKSDHV